MGLQPEAAVGDDDGLNDAAVVELVPDVAVAAGDQADRLCAGMIHFVAMVVVPVAVCMIRGQN